MRVVGFVQDWLDEARALAGGMALTYFAAVGGATWWVCFWVGINAVRDVGLDLEALVELLVMQDMTAKNLAVFLVGTQVAFIAAAVAWLGMSTVRVVRRRGG